jgi:hypothetical protein
VLCCAVLCCVVLCFALLYCTVLSPGTSLATKDEWSLIKTLPICVRIFDVCQEHLTGFNLISQSRSTMTITNIELSRKKTPLNFVMRIDNVLSATVHP